MNMLLRLLWLVLRAKFRPHCHPLGPCETPFIVLPTDLDIYGHMNNGIYFSIMDLGRVDMLIRSGLLRAMRKGGLSPVVAAETIRFRRPLRPLRRFTLETRVMGWDDKAFLMEQRFLTRAGPGKAPEIVAEAIVRARFLSKGNAVPAERFLALLGEQGTASPPLPDWVAAWNARQSRKRDFDHVSGAEDRAPDAS